MEKVEEERKLKLSFRSVPNRCVIENSKKIATELKKIKKIPLWRHFKPKQVGKGSERENKNYRFVSFRSDLTRKRKFKLK